VRHEKEPTFDRVCWSGDANDVIAVDFDVRRSPTIMERHGAGDYRLRHAFTMNFGMPIDYLGHHMEYDENPPATPSSAPTLLSRRRLSEDKSEGDAINSQRASRWLRLLQQRAFAL
jgi:hypothetical protein